MMFVLSNKILKLDYLLLYRSKAPQSNFIKITLRHGCSSAYLLHISRTPFPRNTSGWLLLQIDSTMRKIASNKLTTGMLTSDFNEKIEDFISSDRALTFINSIKGTPAYWKMFYLMSWP